MSNVIHVDKGDETIASYYDTNDVKFSTSIESGGVLVVYRRELPRIAAEPYNYFGPNKWDFVEIRDKNE